MILIYALKMCDEDRSESDNTSAYKSFSVFYNIYCENYCLKTGIINFI